MALQSEMAATLQHHHTNGVLVSSAASPTPSIDSLTGMVVASNGTNAGLNGDSGHEHSESGLASAGSGGLNTGANTDRVSSSSASSSGLGSSPLGNGSLFSSNATKCAICSGTFQRPKVLQCFHTYCQACLEKVQDHPDRVSCPQCHNDTTLGSGGVAGLLSDYGITGLMEMVAAAGSAGNTSGLDFAGTFCTGCKSRESAAAVARCMTCANFLCPNCVMAHKFMHCFEGHHVTTLGEITSKDGNRTEIQELDSISHVVHDGKSKASEVRSQLKNLESTSSRLSAQYNKAQNEINETFQYYTTLLEERKAEIMRELDGHYTMKQMALNAYSQKGQETIDKIYQVTDFIERLMKHATNGEVLLFKRPIETKFSKLLTGGVTDIFSGLNEDEVVDFEFISNPQAIQTSVKNTFGYVRSRNTSGTNSVGSGSGVRQPPISRPTSSNSSSIGSAASSGGSSLLNSLMNNSTSGCLSNGLAQGIAATLASTQNGGLQNGHAVTVNGHGGSVQSHSAVGNGLKEFLLEQQHLQQHSSRSFLANSSNGGLNGGSLGGHTNGGNAGGGGPGLVPTSTQPLNNNVFENGGGGNGLLSKRFSSPSSQSSGLGPLGYPGDLGGGLNPYEKWSNGSDKLFDQHTSDSILELSSKLLNLGHQAPISTSTALGGNPLSQNGSSAVQAINGGGGGFPPKSQIKRQKMVYHCKFGEFGVLEGQFTEPSGVAVNAQNDIVVADTNNHRIQIFDKEGRFKFQFGECGKRDGQLLYPNRVAVVRSSGDIIVTERSPTHQVQIYNQYGQFVRKFGANILQHPRGVTVDNKGRIIVVECKVMRVIIFDQAGNVLNKFGCSKHLEFPNGVVVNDRQEIFISDNRAHCVKVFNYEGVYLRQIGGEGITNYPIGVGINAAGEVIIADNHNNFNLSVFSQDGQLLAALESKVKHAQCFDVSLMDDGSVVLASKDYRLYIYRYVQVPPIGM